MGSLHRAQIYIEEDQMQQLKLEAERGHLGVSELVRKAIRYFLTTREGKINWDKDPLSKIVGKIKLKVTDASVDHDKYLYGKRGKDN